MSRDIVSARIRKHWFSGTQWHTADAILRTSSKFGIEGHHKIESWCGHNTGVVTLQSSLQGRGFVVQTPRREIGNPSMVQFDEKFHVEIMQGAIGTRVVLPIIFALHKIYALFGLPVCDLDDCTQIDSIVLAVRPVRSKKSVNVFIRLER